MQALFKEVKRYGDAWNNRYESLRNLLLQLHSMKVAHDLQDWEADVVVGLRIDLEYLDFLKEKDITYDAPCARIPLPFVPLCTSICEWFYGFNDRLLLSHRSHADVLFSRIKYVLDYCRTTKKPLHAEKFLKWLCHTYGIRREFLQLRAARIRCGGTVDDRDKHLYSSKLRGHALFWSIVVLLVLALVCATTRRPDWPPGASRPPSSP